LVVINGAGATFPYPLYSKWFSEYRKVDPAAEINYQSIGSGGGIRQFLDGTIDFGATDAPMTPEQKAKAKGPVFHVPTALGAVVVTYNLAGVAEPLRLAPETLASIFLGKITQWNDPRLTALNPGVSLPAQPIALIHRSDASGTTAIFSEYLGQVSSEWRETVGVGPALKWPAGLGGKGNEGVTGLVRTTPGALGYVELVYARTNGLPMASLRNRAGRFVSPSEQSLKAAAEKAVARLGSNPVDELVVSIVDSEGQEAYPIASFTYLLVSGKMSGAKGKTLVAFLGWALGDGQKLAPPLHYAPLPEALIARVEARVRQIVVE
jgi:phosphate transport system substrate-binding protein